MTMKKIALIYIIGAYFVQIMSAQTVTDALRYSYLIPGGTARVLGTGGSFGAMGADFGSMGINVAGLADYRSKEVMFSLSYNNASVNTLNNGQLIGDGSNNGEFVIENIGYVSHNRPYGSKMVTSNFAIGFQNFANYNQVVSYNTQSVGSIVEMFAEQANTDNYGAFDTQLADESGAIFYDEDLDLYIHDLSDVRVDPTGIPFSADNRVFDQTNKSETIERSGRMNELSLAWAGKWKGGLALGLGIGIPFLEFEENRFYSEADTDGDPAGFNRLNYNESLETGGVGFNAKLGLGYSLMLNKVYDIDSMIVGANVLRFGLSAQTPTWYRLEDLYSTSMQYDCELCSAPETLYESQLLDNPYRLNTPYRLVGSVGFLYTLGKVKGFINADATYLNYAANQFNASSSAFFQQDDQAFFDDIVNPDIEFSLGTAMNYNLGTELNYNIWRLRAGVGLYSSPFAGETNFDKVYSLGLGVRGDFVYLDLAYQVRETEEGYRPYDIGVSDRSFDLVNESRLSKIVMTFGIKLGQ